MTTESKLTNHDKDRYARHLILPEVGEAGQLRLQRSKVLVVGLGGLGNPVVSYLAAAGVGELGLVDADTIELSNLQRQPLFTPDDIGKAKVEVAKQRIQQQNSAVKVNAYAEFLNSSNAIQIIQNYDLVIDGTDNLSVRYLINDACLLLNKPFVYGAIFRFSGQVSVFNGTNNDNKNAACYRCLFPVNPKPDQIMDCNAGGVLGVLPGLVGSLQAIEAIKWLLDIGENLHNRLLQFDALTMQFSTIGFTKKADCSACSEGARIQQLDMPEYAVLVDIKTIAKDDPLLKQANINLLDVRNDNELEQSSVSGAVHIPLPELKQRILELDTTKSYFVFCQSGKRAMQAAKLLLNHNFVEVRVIEGGLPNVPS